MKYNIDELVTQALDSGFDAAGELNVAALEFLPEVREMCAADKCRSFGKNWCCPPACGSIEDSARRAREYSRGVLIQTVGKMEDDFDYETIQNAQQRHSRNFTALIKSLRIRFGDVLPMGAGACILCPECTYPHAPCRFPDEAIISMEAYGLFVSRVCELSGVPYNHGKHTVTFTSCYLLK